MTAFNEHQFEKKLQYLKDSQESIQSLSSWCLQHRQHHKKIVASWLRVVKKVKVEHRLTLFYLANDVIQYSKRKSYEFVESWGLALQKATPMVREDKVKHKILRIFKIWNDRGVYEDTFVSDLCGLLSTHTKKTQPEPALVDTEFQSSVLFTLIRSCAQLDDETDARLRTLKESPISVCDVDGICSILKDRRQGDDLVVEVDEGITKMQVYVDALQKEIKEREQMVEQLEQAQIYYSSQYGEAKIVCNAYRNFGNRVKQLKRKLDELIPSLKDASPLPSPDVNAPSPSPDSDVDLPGVAQGADDEEEEEGGFTPEGRPIKDDSHSLDNCFTSFLGNAASLPFDLQKNLFGESSPRLALTPSPIHNLLDDSGELPLLSLSATSEGKPIEVISSRSKPDEGFSISDFFKNLSTNIPGLDVDAVDDGQLSPTISKDETFSSVPDIMESITSRYEYSPISTTTNSLQLTDVASRYEYSAMITTPNTVAPLPPPPVPAADSGSRYEYSAIMTTPTKQQYEYPPVVMTPNAPPPPPASDPMTQYDKYAPANTIQAAATVPASSVPRYDNYTPAISTPNVPPPPSVKSSVYNDYAPAISTPTIPPPPVKSSVYNDYAPAISTPTIPPPPVKNSVYNDYAPAISTPTIPPPPVKNSVSRYNDYAPTNVPPPPLKGSVSRYDDYTPAMTTSVPPPAVKQYEGYPPTVTTMQPPPPPPPPMPEMMETGASHYKYPPVVSTPTPLQPPPLPPNLFPLDKYSHDEDKDAWVAKKDVTPSWSAKLPPKFPTWGDTAMETEWTPAMPVMPLDLDTPESPPMYEKEGFSDPVEYDEASDVDHRTLVTLQVGDVDHRSLAHVSKKDVDHRPASMRKKDVDHRNLISLTGSPLRDVPWARADQDYRTVPKATVAPAVVAGEQEADRDYRVPRPLGQEMLDNVESVDMELSDEETLEPAGARRDAKPLVSFNISPIKVLPSSPLHEKDESKPRAPLFPTQRIPTIGGNVKNFRGRGAGGGNSFARPPPLPRGFRPAPLAPPPPPPSQFFNDTDRFRTPPPQLHTPPPTTRHNAPNFFNRSPVRNNVSAHVRNFSIQPVVSGPLTCSKNSTLSYPNVKPLAQIKLVPSGGVRVPVSMASTPTQTERTLAQVKPQQMDSPAKTPSSPQGQATQQPSDGLAEEQQSPQSLLPSPQPSLGTRHNPSDKPSVDISLPAKSVQNTTLAPSVGSKSPTTPTSPVQNTTLAPSVDCKSRTTPTSPLQNTSTVTSTSSVQNTTVTPSVGCKSPVTYTSSVQNTTVTPSGGCKSPVTSTSPLQNTTLTQFVGSKPPTTPTSPVENTSKLLPQSLISGTKPPTSPVQCSPKLPMFGGKSPTMPTSPVQNTIEPPHFGSRPPAMPTRSVMNNTRPPLFGARPPSTPASPVQNITRPQPPSFGSRPPSTPASPIQNITRPPPPSFGPRQPSTPPSLVQNVTRPPPPSFGARPPSTPASPVQNITRPPSFGPKPPTTCIPVKNGATTSSVGTKPPTVATSLVQNASKPPPVGTKPPSVPTSPVQDILKSPPLSSGQQSQPNENTAKPLVASVPQPVDVKVPPDACKIPTSSQNTAAEHTVGNKLVNVAEPAETSGPKRLPFEPAGWSGAMKREHEDEPWMNDDIPEFGSQDADLEPQAKVQGLSMPLRGRGAMRGLPYSPRMRPPHQWRGPPPSRNAPPHRRFPYRPPPPPPPLLAGHHRPPARLPFRPAFRARPRGRW